MAVSRAPRFLKGDLEDEIFAAHFGDLIVGKAPNQGSTQPTGVGVAQVHCLNASVYKPEIGCGVFDYETISLTPGSPEVASRRMAMATVHTSRQSRISNVREGTSVKRDSTVIFQHFFVGKDQDRQYLLIGDLEALLV